MMCLMPSYGGVSMQDGTHETLYRDLADEWMLYDNSGEQPLVLAEES